MDPTFIAEIKRSTLYCTPELMLSITFIVVLIAEIFAPRGSYKTFGLITAAGIAGSLALALQANSLPPSLLFFRMITFDGFAVFFKFVFGISTILVVLFSMDSEELRAYNPGEYFCLILAVVLGMNFLASANNLLMIWLALELVSIPSYLLSGFLKNDRLSAEAALKFVIYGAVSTAVMMFGFSYLYGMTGVYELNEIRAHIASAGIPPGILMMVLALILVGIGYKIAAVPFHFWCPDVYQGSPVVITAFFSIGPKAAGFAFLIRFFYSAFAHGGPHYQVIGQFPWPALMAWIAAITMTLGNVVAIWQSSMKRMLAYSSIAHVGYMMMGFVLLSDEGIESILFYLLVYMVMNLGAFLVVVALSSHMDSDDLRQYRGLMLRSPAAASFLAIFMLSLTGIPGLGGFIGKFYLFKAAVHAQLYWLVLVAVINSVVSFVYYGGVVKRMILEDGTVKDPIVLPGLSRALLALLAVMVFVMGLYWDPFVKLSQTGSLLLQVIHVALK